MDGAGTILAVIETLLLRLVSGKVNCRIDVVGIEEHQPVCVIISAHRCPDIIDHNTISWPLEVANEVVGEAWFSTYEADERRQLHVLFDHSEIFWPDVLQAKAIADDNQHVIAPLSLLALSHRWLPSLGFKVEAHLTNTDLRCSHTKRFFKLSRTRLILCFFYAAAGLQDSHEGDVTILEGADPEVVNRSIALL